MWQTNKTINYGELLHKNVHVTYTANALVWWNKLNKEEWQSFKPIPFKWSNGKTYSNTYNGSICDTKMINTVASAVQSAADQKYTKCSIIQKTFNMTDERPTLPSVDGKEIMNVKNSFNIQTSLETLENQRWKIKK